jgi:hypothetical protein
MSALVRLLLMEVLMVAIGVEMKLGWLLMQAEMPCALVNARDRIDAPASDARAIRGSATLLNEVVAETNILAGFGFLKIWADYDSHKDQFFALWTAYDLCGGMIMNLNYSHCDFHNHYYTMHTNRI